ncbi:MAG: STAS domain-containing protein [Clostridia bacterium]|nr:STAS domain-containing protein [Clostridia bacterium]
MSGELKLRQENKQEGTCIYISGEVDIYSSQGLKEKLYEIVDSSEKDIIFDCSELNYIDSTGLGIFVGALKKAKQNNKRIIITKLKENIKKLFVITGLDKVFVIEE